MVCGISGFAKDLAEAAGKGASTEALWFETKADFLAAMNDIIKDGDNVLVKASHGVALSEVVEELEKF